MVERQVKFSQNMQETMKDDQKQLLNSTQLKNQVATCAKLSLLLATITVEENKETQGRLEATEKKN